MFSKNFLQLLTSHAELQSLQDSYALALPFPHCVLSDVFSQNTLDLLCQGFPQLDDSWWHWDNVFEKKYAKDNLCNERLQIKNTIADLQSRQFTDFLETITGIRGLIVDQTLRGGGLHQIAKGGYLAIHADHNVHPVTKLDRRLNVLLYLNSFWKEEWGGHLEFWDKNMRECVQKIGPEMGRLVIFSTTDTAFHGHPDPLTCPERMTRRSIATYYYSNGRPESERSPAHSVLYQRRPQDPVDPQIERMRAERAKGPLKA